MPLEKGLLPLKPASADPLTMFSPTVKPLPETIPFDSGMPVLPSPKTLVKTTCSPP